MNCCLWMNGRKINTINELLENFDIAAIRGYFLGGSLIKWLISHKGNDIAEKLNDISLSQNLEEQLFNAFGKASKPLCYHKNTSSESVYETNCSFTNSFTTNSFSTEFTSQINNSFTTSFTSSSNFTNYGSFNYFSGLSSFSMNYCQKYNLNINMCPLNKFGYGIHLIK